MQRTHRPAYVVKQGERSPSLDVPERFDSILSAVREIDDPIGIFHLTTAGFSEIGRRVQTLNAPTLVVQEGGYCVPDLGRNVVTFLEGLSGFS